MIITRTPFRISFFGGGTDYPEWYRENPGAVLSTSINKFCYVATRYLPSFFRYKHRIRYSKTERIKSGISDIDHPSVRECLRFLNFKEGIEMVHTADLPGKSGMGSSSAFTVGFLHSLYGLKKQQVSSAQLALEAIHIEQNLIKENVGAQDQTAVAFGGFNRIVFGGPKTVKVVPLKVDNGRLKKLENNLMLFFTGWARNASTIAKEQIQNISKKKNELNSMLALVPEAESILMSKNRNLDDFGRLLNETWQLKRSLSPKITNSKIDYIYSAAMKAGALGGKILGAGAGGFILFYVPPDRQLYVKDVLKKLLLVPFKFENSGSSVIYKADNYSPNEIF